MKTGRPKLLIILSDQEHEQLKSLVHCHAL
jgi:hypothetical protein